MVAVNSFFWALLHDKPKKAEALLATLGPGAPLPPAVPLLRLRARLTAALPQLLPPYSVLEPGAGAPAPVHIVPSTGSTNTMSPVSP